MDAGCLRRLLMLLAVMVGLGVAMPASACPELAAGRLVAVMDHAGADARHSPQHCPGCTHGVSCAASCCGVVLPSAMIVTPGRVARRAWVMASPAHPAGVSPPGSLDPPRRAAAV